MAPPPSVHCPGPSGSAAPASTSETGYRDVAVNLRVISPEAAALGLHWHVTEVQLLLRAFADVKAEDGHARYIRWRNLRGE